MTELKQTSDLRKTVFCMNCGRTFESDKAEPICPHCGKVAVDEID